MNINAIFNTKPEGKIHCFNDDTVITCTGSTWKDIKRRVESEYVKIIIWIQNNKFLMNCEKTWCLIFISYKTSIPNVGLMDLSLRGAI